MQNVCMIVTEIVSFKRQKSMLWMELVIGSFFSYVSLRQSIYWYTSVFNCYHICSCPTELPLFASMFYGFGCDYAIIYVNKIDELDVCMRNVMCAKDIWEVSCRLTYITSSIQMFSVCISFFICWNFHQFKLRNGVLFWLKSATKGN